MHDVTRRDALKLTGATAATFLWAAAGGATAGAADKPTAEVPPAKHFRVEVRTLLDMPGDTLAQELIIETPKPAKVGLMLKGSGGGSGELEDTKKRREDALAKARVVFLLDYLKGGQGRFQGNYLKFATWWGFEQDEHRSGTVGYREAPAGQARLSAVLKRALKSGVYPYAGPDKIDDEAVEVLSVGESRLLPWVYEP